jgi:hypothetical protein
MSWAVTVWSFSTGPPDEKTGAPGEGLCTECHTSFQPSSGDGSLSLSGLPAVYDSAATYSLMVTLSDPDQQRWGFELAVKDEGHQQAGTITVTDAVNTQTSVSNGITYLKHKSAGTFNGTPNGPVSWGFDWTAPGTSTGGIWFYVAGNAANGNGFNSGDYIYNIGSSVGSTGSDVADDLSQNVPIKFELAQNRPNPFNPTTNIKYVLPKRCSVRLVVYNLIGQKVRTLADWEQDGGPHMATWDGRDAQGNDLPGGIYFYRLHAGELSQTKKMVLLR